MSPIVLTLLLFAINFSIILHFIPQLISKLYRKVPDINSGLIVIRKHSLGGTYIRGGLFSGSLIFVGNFALIFAYSRLSIIISIQYL